MRETRLVVRRGRVRPTGGDRSCPALRTLFLAVVLTFVFAAAGASGAISTSRSMVRNGSLTLFTGGTSSVDSSGVARVVTIGGASIWHCPGKVWCGEAVSFAWGPNGRRVAFTLDQIGGNSPYAGFHIVNVVSGQDTLIDRRLDCLPPAELAWSPQGSRLAYTCGGASSPQVNLLRLRTSGYAT